MASLDCLLSNKVTTIRSINQWATNTKPPQEPLCGSKNEEAVLKPKKWLWMRGRRKRKLLSISVNVKTQKEGLDNPPADVVSLLSVERMVSEKENHSLFFIDF